MPDAQIQNKAIELINHLNAAITNVRIYPPTSALISRSIERLSSSLESLLAMESTMIYAESEKNLLIQGEPLPEKEQKKPQIQSFLTMLLTMGIRSLSFEQGVSGTELNDFV